MNNELWTLLNDGRKDEAGETGATADGNNHPDSIDLEDMGARYSQFISFIMNNSNADDNFFEQIKNDPHELKKQWELFKNYYESANIVEKPNRIESAYSIKQKIGMYLNGNNILFRFWRSTFT